MRRNLTVLAGAVAIALGSAGAIAQQQGAAEGLPGQRLGQEAVVSEGVQIYASPAQVRQIEQALNQAGYDAGNIDGVWDDQTAAAARNFQQAQGLEPTGDLNTRLIAALNMEQILSGQGGQQAQAGQGGLPGQRLAQETSAGQGEPISVSPAHVRQVQQALNQKGYDVGNVDGTWGQSTASAARNFQQANGLEPTGTLDLALLRALNVQQAFTGESEGLPGQRLGQEAAVEGTELYISPATVRQIQQALNQAGYDVGNVDGTWGQSTASAARNYQQANGLEPTGTPTLPTLARLGINLQQIVAGTGGQQGAMRQATAPAAGEAQGGAAVGGQQQGGIGGQQQGGIGGQTQGGVGEETQGGVGGQQAEPGATDDQVIQQEETETDLGE